MNQGGRRRLGVGLLAAALLGLAWFWFSPGPGPRPDRGAPAISLLPVPLEALTRFELVVAGKLYRFERDRARRWFFHYFPDNAVHALAHIADPAAAARIDQALRDFASARARPLDPRDLTPDLTGLGRPELIALFYAAASKRPDLRLMIGHRDASGGRFVLVADSGMITLIDELAVDRLLALVAGVERPQP
jgi:hypothetical protein